MAVKSSDSQTQLSQSEAVIEAVRQISRRLLDTWQQSDPVSALQDTLADILRQVAEEVISDQEISAAVYVYDEDEGFSNGEARGPLRQYMAQYPPRKGGTGEYTVQTKQPLFVDDVSTMPAGVPPLSQQALAQGVKAFANLPLLIGEAGQETLVGILLINLQQKYEFNAGRQTLLRLFADQAAIALQNARIHRRRLREQEALQTISESVTSGRPEEVGNTIARQVVELAKAAYASFWSANLEQKQLELIGVYTSNPERYVPPTKLPIDDHSINGYVARTQTPYYAPRLDEDSHHLSWHKGLKAAFCMPLLVRGELIGTLYLASEKENGITPANQIIIKQLSPQVAVALQNARLLVLEQRRSRDLDILNQSAMRLSQTLEAEEAFQVILQAVVDTLKCDYCTIFLAEADGMLVSWAAKGRLFEEMPKLRFAPGEGLAGWVYEQDESLLVNNTAQDKRYKLGSGETEIKPRSMLLSPLRRGEKIIGVVCADVNQPDAFDESNLRLLDTLTLQASAVLQNIEFFNEFQVLHRAANNLARQPTLDQICQTAVQAALETLHCNHSTIFILDEQTDELTAMARVGMPPDAPEIRHFKLGEGLAGIVAQTGQSILVNDAAHDERFIEGKIKPRSINRSVILAPIKIDQAVVGTLSADKEEVNGFTPHNLEMLETLAFDVGIAINLRRQLRQVSDQAQALTKLNQLTQQLVSIEESSQDIKNLLEQVARSAHEVLKADLIELYEYDQKRNEYHLPQILVGERRQPLTPTGNIYPDDAVFQLIYRPDPLYVETVQAEPILSGPYTIERQDQPTERYVIREEICSTAAIPLRTGSETVGLMFANYRTLQKFGREQREIIELFANQAAIAIRNSRLFQEEYARQRELEAISQLQQKISSVGPVEEQLQTVYDATVEAMSGLMDTRNMFIAFYDENTGMIEFSLVYQKGERISSEQKREETPYRSRRFGERKGLTEWVIRHKEPLLIERDFGVWVESQEDVEAFSMGTKCWLGTPMMLRDKIIGVIGLQNFEREGMFDEHHRDLLMTIAGQAAIAIENAKILERRERELRAISQFQQRIITLGLGQERFQN